MDWMVKRKERVQTHVESFEILADFFDELLAALVALW
jgi:hypothetical protein